MASARHVAADDRRIQRAAGLPQSAYRFGELPGDMRLLRIGEVEVVGGPQRLGASALALAFAAHFKHRLDRPAIGVGRHTAAVAVDGHPEGRAVRQLQHSGIGLLGPAHRARLHDRVVVLEERAARGDVGRSEQRQQRVPQRDIRVNARRWRGIDRLAGAGGREVIQRAIVHQRAHGHVPHEHLAREYLHASRVGHGADGGAIHLPLLTQRQDRRQVGGCHHAQHALL